MMHRRLMTSPRAKRTRKMQACASSLSARGRGRALACAVVFVVCATAAALGCGWIGTEQSVRFNGWLSGRDFGRLPPMPFKARGTKKPDEPRDIEEYPYQHAERLAKEADAAWKKADEAASAGDLEGARRLLVEYLKVADNDWCGDSLRDDGCVKRRSSAADMLDALHALDEAAAHAPVRAYIDARRAYDLWLRGVEVENDAWSSRERVGAQFGAAIASSAEEVRRLLDAVPRTPALDDNVAYLRAAVLYRENKMEEAAEAFAQLAARFPKSDRREAALHTEGLARLKSSKSYTGESATAQAACTECRDDAWTKARAAFMRQLADYPRGLYADDARGWLAYLSLRVGDTSEGLFEYYRMLADESNEEGRREALVSLSMARDEATDEDLNRLEAALEREPKAALAYAYHNIYNYALHGIHVSVEEDENPYNYCNKGGSQSCWEYFYKWEKEESGRREDEVRRGEFARVAAFATRMLRRGASGGGAFTLRVAQANLELGDDKAARELAARALSLGVEGDERAAALWVKGVAENHLKDFAATRRTLATLVSEFPDGDLTEGARRLIAMAAEDAGDLDVALEQYLALNYNLDAAYFLDVLMTTEQVASFVERHPDLAIRDEVLYSLGLRHLRAGRYAQAREVYARVSTDAPVVELGNFYFSYDDDKDCGGGWRQCSPKNPNLIGANEKGVSPSWVMHDLQVANDLERLERTVESAQGHEAKAEALYQLAAYVYESSTLRFYNVAMWRGGRYWSLSDLHESNRYRAPGEAQRLFEYMQEHDTIARSIPLFLRVADEYPDTRAARDALYTVAAAHHILGNFNSYWRRVYGAGLHAGARLVSYDDVRRAYPSYRFPRGTDGW